MAWYLVNHVMENNPSILYIVFERLTMYVQRATDKNSNKLPPHLRTSSASPALTSAKVTCLACRTINLANCFQCSEQYHLQAPDLLLNHILTLHLLYLLRLLAVLVLRAHGGVFLFCFIWFFLVCYSGFGSFSWIGNDVLMMTRFLIKMILISTATIIETALTKMIMTKIRITTVIMFCSLISS